MNPLLILSLAIFALLFSSHLTFLILIFTICYRYTHPNPTQNEELPPLSTPTPSDDNGWDIPEEWTEPNNDGWGTPTTIPWNLPTTDVYYVDDVWTQNNGHDDWTQNYGWTRYDLRNATRDYDMWEDECCGEDNSTSWDPSDPIAMERVVLFRAMPMSYAPPLPPTIFHHSHPCHLIPTPAWIIPLSSEPLLPHHSI